MTNKCAQKPAFACFRGPKAQKRAKRFLISFCRYLLIVCLSYLILAPILRNLSIAFTNPRDLNFPSSMWIPARLSVENWHVSYLMLNYGKSLPYTLLTTTIVTLLQTLSALLAGYSFARLKFPGREVVFSALLSMMMLPFEMLVITNYTTIIRLNLNDSLPALIIPFISSIFYTYIMRNFFASIPDSLYWSARVDGCSNWRYLWKVMVPIGRPSLVTVVLLNALASWNSFMWPLLVIKTTKNRTLPFGLYAFTTEAGSQQELIMAASTVVVLPMILLFLFARKQILRGVARGGIKG